MMSAALIAVGVWWTSNTIAHHAIHRPPFRSGLRNRLFAAGLSALVRFEAERARQWFERGIALVELLDRRSAACVLAMAGIYERLLERIVADPERALAQRVALAPWEKAWVAAGSMLAAEPRVRHRRAAAGRAVGGRG